MLGNFPPEIVTNILCRLPPKTLIKCTTLSKSFFSLITSYHFISTHISQNNNTTHLLLRYFNDYTKEEIYHFEADNHNFCGFPTEKQLILPFDNYVGNWFHVVGCVNGVVCLVNDCFCEGTLIILWNPSIKKYVHIPQPKYVFETYGGYESACGFGFDSVSNDYKVVRIVDIGPKFRKTKVEVFSLRSGCWRKFVGAGPAYSIKRTGQVYIPCFLNGSVHWVGSRWKGSSFVNVILTFDVSTERFETIQVPSTLKKSKSKHGPIMDFYVQECNGMLALINRNHEYEDDVKTCSVWVMKEYGVVKSWTKIIDIKNASVNPRHVPLIPRAFGFRKNGEVIMVRHGDDSSEVINAIVLIDPVTHAETFLGEVASDRCSFYMSTYVESMALFKEGKGTNDLTPELMKTTRGVRGRKTKN